jgi:serine/threonine-protein kinase HipA
MRSMIELFLNGRWVPAAEFVPMGGGYRGTFEYLPEYVFSDNPIPVSFALPVTMARQGIDPETGAPPPCPPFLFDLVPQGKGRKFLVHELKVADGDHADLYLAQHGACNPVGNLRLDTAVAFYEKRRALHPEGGGQGILLEDLLSRKDAFLDHIWLHAMLTAGTTGVQGAAPKFLLTQDQDGLWFADAALPDQNAAKHWLVKLPRGSHETDYAVLRNEAAYMRVAAQLGLRVAGEPMFDHDMLFVPRFDRVLTQGGLARLAQETLASLAGVRGFGMPVPLFDLVEGFRPHVNDPVGEIIEFIKRDILNLAMRNTDNHARNTSLQRLPDGTVQLTPVYDFAPMFMDRELIVRGCKWSAEGREVSRWEDIVGLLSLDVGEKRGVLTALAAFAPRVANLPEIMLTCGVDVGVIENCQRHIEAQLKRLVEVKGYGQAPKER